VLQLASSSCCCKETLAGSPPVYVVYVVRVVRLLLQEGLHSSLVYAAIPAAVLLLVLLSAAVLGLASSCIMGTCRCKVFIVYVRSASSVQAGPTMACRPSSWAHSSAGYACQAGLLWAVNLNLGRAMMQEACLVLHHACSHPDEHCILLLPAPPLRII
jgi:hypothetical protein